ncbi:S66 peptidase family protein [Sporolactobacillus kofuensis]|uniref:S66 peptidase family protein n=1 Tax=Sporolactobacillus kofuensis TaxID=269672 RepID=A0ABW1WGV5_9BACL|nr:S66 peptidase family protein [Sporolactobacillus kofuensis]MCO7175323.1 LD-carboxypeptidase [Sporolactobacillus kofuensis]
MPLLRMGDTVGLISCSDGLYPEEQSAIISIEQTLNSLGLKVMKATTLYRSTRSPFSGTHQERAAELMCLVNNAEIKAIFDISGGDSANQILNDLNFEQIRESNSPFIGMSDLSVINNAIYAQTGKSSYHYRVKNLAGNFPQAQQVFTHAFMEDHDAPSFQYRWLRGQEMSGTIIGGNIRCFLKLAGTPYFPDPTNKILFLEALGGGSARMASLLAQLDQLAVFQQCSGVLLGTFSSMQAKHDQPSIEQLVLEVTDRYHLPVAKTEQLGHREDAHCLPIGASIRL